MMKRSIILALSVTSLLFSNLFGEEACKEAAKPAEKICCEFDYGCQHARNRFYLCQSVGQGRGFDGNYTTLGVLVSPVQSCRVLSFFDLKGHLFKSHFRAFNFGFGMRRQLECHNLAVGFNVYYDFRDFKRCDFHQIGIGFEILGPGVEFRYNQYIPVGDKSHTISKRRFEYPGGFVATCRQSVQSFGGLDAELGFWLKRKCPCDYLGIYLGAGPYYYEESEQHHSRAGTDAERTKKRHRWGAAGRAVILLCNCLTLNLYYSDDACWKNRFRAQLCLNMPFDYCCSTSCETECCCSSYCYQPVYRQEIIPARKQCCWDWNW